MPRRDRVLAATLVVAAVALLARLVALGARPFHWDEARVGYWTLRFLRTGVFEYRPVAGGPFLYVVNRWLFTVLPPTDAVARLAVALVGGLLPLVALCFRARPERGDSVGFDDTETVVLAVVLSLAPPVLYYSRFLRGDVPLAAFGLATVGLLHRARVEGSRRYLYAGAAAFGLALAASGFVVAYLVCWLVAGVLTFDERRVRGESGTAALARLRRGLDRVRDWATPLARAALLTVGVATVFYVPRGVVDLSRPSTLLVALERALVGSLRKFVGVRVLDRRYHGHSLLPYVGDHVETLLTAALVVVVLALAGFALERYTAGTRPLVSFGAYWGGVGLLVFPAVTEVSAPWVTVHTLVPLALPAAVGGGRFVRYARRAGADRDAARLAVVGLLLVAGGAQVGVTLSEDVYGPAQPGGDLVQYAQPSSDLDPMLAAAAASMEGNAGTDVLYVGEGLAVADESVLDQPPVPPAARDAFSRRLPLPWYFARMNAETASVGSAAALPADAPPVVVADASLESKLEERLPEYRAFEIHLALFDRTVVVFVEGG